MQVIGIFLLVILISAANTHACELKQVSFGSSIDQVISNYHLNSDDFLDLQQDGEFMIAGMGNESCDELPKQSMIEFTFIDDKLVKITITTPNISQSLLKYAKKIYGNNDDIDRKKSRSGEIKIALWNEKAGQIMIYGLNQNQDESKYESLSIVSKGHDELFAKIAKEKGQAANDYLKENGLGKYSSDYNSASGQNVKVKTDYDPNALQNLKDRYDRQQKGWNDKNKASSRRGR